MRRWCACTVFAYIYVYKGTQQHTDERTRLVGVARPSIWVNVGRWEDKIGTGRPTRKTYTCLQPLLSALFLTSLSPPPSTEKSFKYYTVIKWMPITNHTEHESKRPITHDGISEVRSLLASSPFHAWSNIPTNIKKVISLQWHSQEICFTPIVLKSFIRFLSILYLNRKDFVAFRK